MESPVCKCGHSKEKHEVKGLPASSGCLDMVYNLVTGGFCTCEAYNPKVEVVGSGVCHCGQAMEGHSVYDNHSPLEMMEPAPSKMELTAAKIKEIVQNLEIKSIGALAPTAKLDIDGSIAGINDEAEGWGGYAQMTKAMKAYALDDVISTKNLIPIVLEESYGKMWSQYFDELVEEPYQTPSKQPTAQSEMAKDYLQQVAKIGTTVLNGWPLEVLMAGFAAHMNDEMTARMDDLVNKRVKQELSKRHRRDCIPSFKKNDRKFR